MRLITAIFATMLAVAVFAPTQDAQASVTYFLCQDNNKNILEMGDCPTVTATEVGGNLEVAVSTPSDVLLEQFGFEWGPPITADDISEITIFGGVAPNPETAGTFTWELDNNLFASMDGFGQFDVVFNLSGQGSQAGVHGEGTTQGTAALWFVILGGSIADFDLTSGPNCNSLVGGCIHAAKISSEQLGYAGGFVSNVPLPGAVWLFLSALAGLFGVGYARRSRAA